MAKKIKITEAQLEEFIDKEGSIPEGDYNGSDSQVRTNYYRKNQRPQTSDDYADETSQKMRWYLYRGFSFAEGLDRLAEEESMDIDNDMPLDNQNNTIDFIPNYKELSKSYEQPQLQNDLDDITIQLTSLGLDEETENDIKAIVLKQILKTVDISILRPEQQKELKQMIK